MNDFRERVRLTLCDEKTLDLILTLELSIDSGIGCILADENVSNLYTQRVQEYMLSTSCAVYLLSILYESNLKGTAVAGSPGG